MTHSPLTNQIRLSKQFSSRNGVRVDTFLIHHQAGTNDDAVIAAMVSGSKQVSANYTISNEGRLTCVVDEDFRAWTSGSTTDGGKGAAWDRRSITVEIENESGAPEWRISAAAIDTAARLLIDLRKRYPIANVLGHRDLWTRFGASYPTFCPGPETLARILAREAEIIGGGGVVVVDEADKAKVRRIAAFLNDQGYGKTTTAAVDGLRTDPGQVKSIYWELVQTWGRRNGHYPAPDWVIDGEPGPRSIAIEGIIDELLTRPVVAPADPGPVEPAPVTPTPEPPVPAGLSDADVKRVVDGVLAGIRQMRFGASS